MYGWCHCGCGARPALAPQDRTSKGYRRGHPYRYLMHHGPLQCIGFDEHKGVHLADVVWMLQAMQSEGMTVAAISRATGMSESHIFKLLTGWRGQRFVQRKTAARIEKAYDRLDRHLHHVHVPMGPMRDYLAINDISPAQLWPKGSYYIRQFYRPTASYLVADEMAVSAGAHPSEVWGPMWWELAA